uniref:NADH-ubiquinone oxidoreductase chain 3 n=1 Tax=Orthotrichia sp. XG-2021 TaxID=2996738 RepID=A0A9E8LP53_9NEOP|nr:NADH dehydrogenase subunit 3 [Orthotrichia sp. XG-2021]
MFYLLNMMLMIFIILNIFMLIMFMFNLKKMKMFKKISSFECGFTMQSLTRLPMSIYFFFIAMIFLIFDVEIVLIIPMIMILKYNNFYIWMSMSMYFLIILLMSIFHEWNQMMINWNN